MIEEEYFRKSYPDACYGDKPLSPYWDYFQEGVEFGERQSEKKIEELEQENTVLTQNLEDTEIVNKALEKENTELKERNAELKGMYAHSAREAETYKQFLELKEKENVELNETLGKCAKMPVLYCLGAKETIAKAKELLKEFVQHYKAKTIYVENMQDLLEQSEQFISEVEK